MTRVIIITAIDPAGDRPRLAPPRRGTVSFDDVRMTAAEVKRARKAERLRRLAKKGAIAANPDTKEPSR